MVSLNDYETSAYDSGISSLAWGNQQYPVSQGFGVKGFRPDWYLYSANHGWPSGYHIGLDVAMPKGTAIYANESGKVEHAGWSDSFRPNPVYIRESDGDLAIYGHLWTNTVRTGDRVERGQLIGYSGEQTIIGTMTPDGSGPHLHYELLDSSNMAINPIPELTQKLDGDETWRLSGDGITGGSLSLGSIDYKSGGLRIASMVIGVGAIVLAFFMLKNDVLPFKRKG